jgi:type I restriction enzyme M protein
MAKSNLGEEPIETSVPATISEPKKAKKSKKDESQGLEASLWQAADKLRSQMDAAEYKHVVLGLIFLKYVSDVFNQRRVALEALVNNPDSDYFMPTEAAKESILESRDEYTSEGVFWVPEGHRWDDLRKAAKQPDIGSRIDAAMDAIEKENDSLKGVLPKNYARRELTPATLGGLIDTFSREDLTSAEHEGLDVLGRVFEYMVGQFASAEGKLGGEFYTPRSVVQLLVEMLEPFNGRVYDPACGSGGMFVQADKFVKAHGGSRNDISVFGQEMNPTTWRLAKMNLALRGIDANLGAQWGDSFSNDQHPDLRADFVIANPPFNISDWGGEHLRDDPRWKYGTPPAGNANYAWIQHMLHHLAPTGTMATVLANGSLSTKTSGEGEIRKNLVEADLVECIVALPDKLFYSVAIPVSLWFLTKDKTATGGKSEGSRRDRRGEVLFIDARQLGAMVTRTVRELSQSDKAKIADTYKAWRGEPGLGEYEGVPGFCASVKIEEIARHDYALTPGRYVGSEEAEYDGEPIDEKISRLTASVLERFAARQRLETEVVSALDSIRASHDA